MKFEYMISVQVTLPILVVATYLFSMPIQAQIYVDSSTYHFYTDKKSWYLDEEVYNLHRLKNYEGCAAAVDALIRLDSSSLIYGYAFHGALCHDRIGNWERALSILELLHSKGSDVMCRMPRSPSRSFNNEILQSDRFRSICPEYPLAFDKSEVPDTVYLDSLIRLYVWTHDSAYRHMPFINMGYEYLYDEVPNMPLFDRKKLAMQKKKALINRLGYPSADKIGNNHVSLLVYLDVIHSGDLNTLLKHQNEVKDNVLPRRYALLLDKISEAKKEPQLYGTQVVLGKDGELDTFYPIVNLPEINDRRMKVGLPPLESYANIHGVSLEGMDFKKGFD